MHIVGKGSSKAQRVMVKVVKIENSILIASFDATNHLNYKGWCTDK